MGIRTTVLAVFLCLSSGLAQPASADMTDKAIDVATKLGEEAHSVLAAAQQIGFLVDEVRFEMSLTPKVEVYFRDVGDNGQYESVTSGAPRHVQAILELLQATRKFSIAHYSPKGVKLITGAAKPSVEIITLFSE
jgi:hypothetical protein